FALPTRGFTAFSSMAYSSGQGPAFEELGRLAQNTTTLSLGTADTVTDFVPYVGAAKGALQNVTAIFNRGSTWSQRATAGSSLAFDLLGGRIISNLGAKAKGIFGFADDVAPTRYGDK